jgi:DME family drug/metabolite transporter
MNQPSLRARSGPALMIGAAVLWGTVGVAVLHLHDEAGLSAGAIAWLRSLVAAAVLLPAVALGARRRRAPIATALVPSRAAGRLMLAVGAGTAAFQTAYFAAVAMVGVSVSTLISLGLTPLLVAVAETVLLGARHGRRVHAAVAASIAGLVLLVAPGSDGGHHDQWLLGCLLAALSAVGYATVTLMLRARDEDTSGATLTAGTFAVGAVLLAPLAVGAGDPSAWSLATIGLLVYLGLVPSALAYALFFAALRTLPATASAVASLLEPLTAAVLAWLLVGERLGAAGLIGSALVLLAVAAVASEGRAAPATG